MQRHRPLALALAGGLALAAFAACSRAHDEPPPPPPAARGTSVWGTLHVTAFGGAAAPRQTAPQHHRSVWFDGLAYAGMEDNDIRGFLDGHFLFDWNQPTQTHVRAGRWPRNPHWGEYEMFRTLQRWGGISIPPDARVTRTALHVKIEGGPTKLAPLSIMLYEVKKDWNPGAGGELRNNTSTALDGEVVWDQVAHGGEPWTLPGVSFASDTDPRADTGAGPLAKAVWKAGQKEIVFESPQLAAYAQRRARRGEPLLFLLKLGDPQEDLAKSCIRFYSANVDTDRNPERRPHLVLEWESTAGQAAWERPLSLEHGRDLVFTGLDPGGADRVAVDFEAQAGSDEPTLEYREGGAGAAWRPAPPVFRRGGGPLALRLRGAREPIARGDAFEASFRNTWVRTGKPPKQRVEWTFVAPSGEVHHELAHFQGDYTWKVHFEPDELGRWRAFYDHDLSDPYHSADAVFDVLPGDCAHVAKQLRALPARIVARYATEKKRKASVLYFGPEFWQLERAAARCSAPGSPGPGLAELRDTIAKIRHTLEPLDTLPEPKP